MDYKYNRKNPLVVEIRHLDGEASYSNEITEQLERIVNWMKDAMTEIAVVHIRIKWHKGQMGQGIK